MDNNERERDTHFQGFAKLLYADLDLMISELCIERSDSSNLFVKQVIQDIQKLIAQHAYDLVEYAIVYTERYGNIEIKTIDESVHVIPDLTEWPTPTEPQ